MGYVKVLLLLALPLIVSGSRQGKIAAPLAPPTQGLAPVQPSVPSNSLQSNTSLSLPHSFEWPTTWPFSYVSDHEDDRGNPGSPFVYSPTRLKFRHGGIDPGIGQKYMCRKAFRNMAREVLLQANMRYNTGAWVRYRPAEFNLDMDVHIPYSGEGEAAHKERWARGELAVYLIGRLSNMAGCRSLDVDLEYREPGSTKFKLFGNFALHLHGRPRNPPEQWPDRARFPLEEPLPRRPGDLLTPRLRLDPGNPGLPQRRGDPLESRMQARMLTAAHVVAFPMDPHEQWVNKHWEHPVEPMMLDVANVNGLTNSLAERAIEKMRNLVLKRGAIQLQAAILEGIIPRGWLTLTIPQGMQ